MLQKVHAVDQIQNWGMSHQPNNIFAGTQVVARVAVQGANHSLVHPRGAVGVVTRTPAGPTVREKRTQGMGEK